MIDELRESWQEQVTVLLTEQRAQGEHVFVLGPAEVCERSPQRLLHPLLEADQLLVETQRFRSVRIPRRQLLSAADPLLPGRNEDVRQRDQRPFGNIARGNERKPALTGGAGGTPAPSFLTSTPRAPPPTPRAPSP